MRRWARNNLGFFFGCWGLDDKGWKSSRTIDGSENRVPFLLGFGKGGRDLDYTSNAKQVWLKNGSHVFQTPNHEKKKETEMQKQGDKGLKMFNV